MSSNRLCATCKALPLQELLGKAYATWKAATPERTAFSEPWPEAPWHSALIALSLDCFLCQLVLEGLRRFRQYHMSELEAEGNIIEGSRIEVKDEPITEISVYLASELRMSLLLSSPANNRIT